jgi:hypothetical protein
MNVYLLPHHRLDPRFQYTLEREVPSIAGSAAAKPIEPTVAPSGWLRRQFWRLRNLLRRLKIDYDQVVHGHEQIRLSRLLLMMDRDPELTLVIPAGMTRDSAMEAVRGAIRAGQMGLRSHAARNVGTTVLMFIILFLILPLHFTAVIFLPLLILYAWLRFWEDRLIRRIMTHLLEVRLTGNDGGRFREEVHLAQLQEIFSQGIRPNDAYHDAMNYLDGLDHKVDGQSAPEHTLMFNYYRDIGRLDPYERYQDRLRKKLVESVKLLGHHLWAFWKGVFRWSLSTSRVVGLRLPNVLFILVAALGIAYGGIWAFSWWTQTSETFPEFVRASVEIPEHAKIVVEAWPLAMQQSRGQSGDPDTSVSDLFELKCPIDSSRIDLWSLVSEMISKHQKRDSGTVECSGVEGQSRHRAIYKVQVKY